MNDADDWGPEDDIKDDRVTVFAGGLLQPIADLIGTLALTPVKSDRSVVGERENGYCISILMLSVLAFESLVGRISHLRKLNLGVDRQQSKTESNSHTYLPIVDPSFPAALLEDLTDIYVLRDAIAHGHIWTVEYMIRRDAIDVTSRSIHPGYGDTKHKLRVDQSTGLTHRLALNALPSEIGLREAATALKTLASCIRRLVDAGAIELPAVQRRVRYNGSLVPFWSLSHELERLWIEKPAIRQPPAQG